MVQITAWHWPGEKPLFERMMVSLLTYKCVTQPQWVKCCGNVCGINGPLWRESTGAFFIDSQNKLLNKQLCCQWPETQWCSCDVSVSSWWQHQGWLQFDDVIKKLYISMSFIYTKHNYETELYIIVCHYQINYELKYQAFIIIQNVTYCYPKVVDYEYQGPL